MRAVLLLLLLLPIESLWAGPPPLPARIPVFEYEVRPSVLEQAMRVGARFPLPRFIVFDRQGRAVFFVQGAWQTDIVSRLEAALASGARIAANPLDTTLNDLIDHNDQTPRRSLLPAADFYLFQYHAGWCEGCTERAAELADWAAAQRSRRIVWISVLADPTNLSPRDLRR